MLTVAIPTLSNNGKAPFTVLLRDLLAPSAAA
jgi:hypothetical protein